VHDLLSEKYIPVKWWDFLLDKIPFLCKFARYKIECHITSDEITKWIAYSALVKEEMDIEIDRQKFKSKLKG